MTETRFYLLHSIFLDLKRPLPCMLLFSLSHFLVNVRSLRQGFCPSWCQIEPAPGQCPALVSGRVAESKLGQESRAGGVEDSRAIRRLRAGESRSRDSGRGTGTTVRL